jgi:hypothetical protein
VRCRSAIDVSDLAHREPSDGKRRPTGPSRA